jgi:hypothetical protein
MMIFGLGRKKDRAPTPIQMSPEGMAMLNRLARESRTGTAQAALQETDEGADAVTGNAAAMARHVTGTTTTEASSEPAGVALSAREQRNRLREEKKAAAIAKREEKDFDRRRRRNAKSRFSRTRYLNDANGNAASAATLAGIFLAVTIIVPLVVNALFLLPATRSNQEIIEEVRSLKSLVDQAQPILKAAIGQKSEREQALQDRLAQFVASDEATGALRRFVSDLESRGATLKTETSGTVVNTNLELAGLSGKSMTLEMKVDFLDYLLVRNRFVRSQPRIDLSEETIVAAPGNPIVDVRLVLMVPAKI